MRTHLWVPIFSQSRAKCHPSRFGRRNPCAFYRIMPDIFLPGLLAYGPTSFVCQQIVRPNRVSPWSLQQREKSN